MEDNTKFICPLCGNKEEKFIGYFDGKQYCRKCISFLGEPAYKDRTIIYDGEVDLEYKLTEKQEIISNKIIHNFMNKKNTLVYAVTGAGKTELVYNIISICISKKLKVGFAVPRKDVVVELYSRFSNVFKHDKIIALYGGHTSEKDAGLVILTTHQLYRYNQYFDLLILDEIDAFPYANSDILHSLFKRAVRGNYILLTATPTEEYIERFKSSGGEVLTLLRRHHNHDLPVPVIYRRFGINKFYFLLKTMKRFIKENKPMLIFVPTIAKSEEIFRFCRLFYKKGDYVSSEKNDRNTIIMNFRKGKYDYLITTSILERGVTIPNLQVIIVDADSEIYSSESLVQISGRAGRSKDFPNGEVIFIAKRKTKAMVKAVETIKRANASI